MLKLRVLQARVQNSAKLLDSEVPGWHTQINLNKLNMNDWSNCVCGQLKLGDAMAGNESRGFYLEFTEKLDNYGQSDKMKKNGFINEDSNMRVLRRLWTFQIKKRLRCDERKAIDAIFRC